MHDSTLMIMTTASGLVIGTLLHFATPTEIAMRTGQDWRDSIPRHPDPAALISRNVQQEYASFDYSNQRELVSAAYHGRAALLEARLEPLPAMEPLPPAPRLSARAGDDTAAGDREELAEADAQVEPAPADIAALADDALPGETLLAYHGQANAGAR